MLHAPYRSKQSALGVLSTIAESRFDVEEVTGRTTRRAQGR